MENELYVKAWFLLVVAGMLIATGTGTAIYFVEAQNTQNLLNKMTNNFEEQLIALGINQSIAISQLATDFASLNIESTELVAQKTSEINNLTTQAIALQATIDAQIVTYNELYAIYETTLGEKSIILTQLNETIIQLQETSQELSDALELLNGTVLYNKYNLHDFPLANVTAFIEADLTNTTYMDVIFRNITHVTNVSNNATNLGYRCGILFFYNATNNLSYFNVFDTTDSGLRYVNTTDYFFDTIASIEAVYGANNRYFTLW